MHAALRFAAGVALAAPAAAVPTTTVLEALPGFADIDRTTTTQDIDFKRDRYDRMTVPVRVSGQGPYRFLVDTGADRTVVSSALAGRLKLIEGPTARMHSLTGTSQVRTASVPRLDLGIDRTRSLDAAVLEAENMGADGILGVDSLRSQRVLFDFRAGTLSIVPSARRSSREDKGTIVVQGKLQKGHLIVTNATAQDMPVTIVLDTGAQMTIGNEALRRKLEARRKLGEPEPVVLISVTGAKLLGNVYHIKELKIGDITLHRLAVVFADVQTFHTLGLEERPTMLLGMNAMRAFDKVSIDFARRKLRILLPEHSSADGVRMAARY
ncbi:MAG: retroviral-like aspartic protease family protein [Sphingomicrobium sp.]